MVLLKSLYSFRQLEKAVYKNNFILYKDQSSSLFVKLPVTTYSLSEI